MPQVGSKFRLRVADKADSKRTEVQRTEEGAKLLGEDYRRRVTDGALWQWRPFWGGGGPITGNAENSWVG
jgi:hypothetical protein